MIQAKTTIIGIAGGSGSGKTTVAKSILEKIGKNRIAYIPHDNYYKDLSNLNESEKEKVNFDHPNSLDTDLLVLDICKLYNGNSVNIPKYDFKTHSRTKETINMIPHNIILIEGILIYSDVNLRNMINTKIYVDTEADERFIRRLKRDYSERGRTIESIINQYQTTVKPMHQQFVEPTKAYADIIIPSGYNKSAVDMVVSGLENIIK